LGAKVVAGVGLSFLADSDWDYIAAQSEGALVILIVTDKQHPITP
jgi:hypothetical protein